MVAPFKAKLGSGGGSKGGVARCLPTFLPIPMLYRVQSGSLAVLSRAKFMRSNPRRVQTKCANKPSQTMAKMQAKIYIETVHRRRSALNCICIGCSSYSYSSNCATPSRASVSAATAAIAKCASHARAPRRDPKPAAVWQRDGKKCCPKDGYLYSVASADAAAETDQTSVAAWIDFGSFG